MHQWHVISLLIHGFLPVNARLLIAFGTAFYAITLIQRHDVTLNQHFSMFIQRRLPAGIVQVVFS